MTHALPSYLTIDRGHLRVDGQDAVSLVEEHGSPLFVFSERRVAGNASSFLLAARGGHPRVAVFFASKACSNLHILRIIRDEGLGIEVNSGGELWKAFAAGFAPEQVLFNGVAKSVEELREAIGRGIKSINVESAFELKRIAEVAASLGKRASVTLRLVPGIGGGATAGIQTGGASSKFGMTATELQEALDVARAHRAALDVVGMHLHIGSQVTEATDFATAVSFTARMSREIGDAIGAKLRILNLGGGYPTDYAHRGRQGARNDVDQFAAARPATAMVGDVAAAAARALGDETEILFEPGRSIVADTAVLLSQAESLRRRGGQPWLYLDAGYNTLLDSTAVRWYFHMMTANRLDDASEDQFRVVGPLCDSADCFFDVEGEYLLKSLLKRLPDLSADQRDILRAEVVRLPSTRRLAGATRPGDIVALLDVGAYSLEEMFQYCGRLRPAAVMIGSDGNVRTIRARDTDQDLMAHERTAEAS
jgi:diaminopimelate decarboxylase